MLRQIQPKHFLQVREFFLVDSEQGERLRPQQPRPTNGSQYGADHPRHPNISCFRYIPNMVNSHKPDQYMGLPEIAQPPR